MRIAVIGAGHMGSWFISKFSTRHQVGLFDSNPDRRMNTGGVTVFQDLSEIEQFQPQLLLNAVNIQNTIEAFMAAHPFIGSDCMLADIASIKGEIPGYYSEVGLKFVSIHPMFGPRFTSMQQLAGESAVVISESDPDGAGFFREFFEGFGIQVFEFSFAKHDELMAYSLTLPFASSIAFSACLRESIVPGTTFARHRHIAKKLLEEDDYLLAEVLFNPHSLEQLNTICSKLEHLKHIIRARDMEEAVKYFSRLRENLES